MPYLTTITDYFEDEELFIEPDDTGEILYERLEKKWNPNNRFPIWKILGDDLPDFIIWLQEQIDDEQEDTTKTITFTPERAERHEELQKEISDTKAELLRTREELSELDIAEDEPRTRGIVERVKSFIRGIFGG